MLNIDYKEFCRIRKIIAKRLRLKIEKYLQQDLKELESKVKYYQYDQSKIKQAEECIQLVGKRENNEFLNDLTRKCESFLYHHKNDKEEFEQQKRIYDRQINLYRESLANFREDYQAEYEFLSSLPINVELIVKPVKLGRPAGLFLILEKQYSSEIEFKSVYMGDSYTLDKPYHFSNDFLGFLQSQEVSKKIKIVVDNKRK